MQGAVLERIHGADIVSQALILGQAGVQALQAHEGTHVVMVTALCGEHSAILFVLEMWVTA